MKKNRILITGGTGFIGYHLAKKCVSLNWLVDSISTKSPSNERKLRIFEFIDQLLQSTGKIGEYDQKI